MQTLWWRHTPVERIFSAWINVYFVMEDNSSVGNISDDEEYVDAESVFNKRCCWWTPSQDSLAVTFCNDTSIHGFKFFGQPKRHITERIFWLIAILMGLLISTYFIYGLWERLYNFPIIVAFQSRSEDVDTLPFPAVTLCNINMFPRTKVKELQIIARDPTHEKYQQATFQLTFVKSVCNAQKSFAKQFGYAFNRATNEDESDNDTINEDQQDEVMDFLLENTIPCDQLVRLCLFGNEIANCSDMFKPIVTDYGKCCTFNMYPLPLLLRDPQSKRKPNVSVYANPVLGSHGEEHFSPPELDEWRKWNYDDGFVLDRNVSRPWKQKRAGQPYGLSILVDPILEEYYCPLSDSEGVRYILHSPLEMPHVMEFSSVAALGKEILVEVHPDMTSADDDIRHIDKKQRECNFGTEMTLKHFVPYTGGNCMDDCTAIVLEEECECSFFYMPRDVGVRICNNDPDSKDAHCIIQARISLQRTLRDTCGHCNVLCEDIVFNYQTTTAELQHMSRLWLDPNPGIGGGIPPYWAENKMSVINIFYGRESIFPKLRKRIYGITDLIANTGGVLGLCLGFSVLSAVEFLYFISLRTICKYYRRRRTRRRWSSICRRLRSKLGNLFLRRRDRVVRVNPNKLAVYPMNPAYRY